MKPSITGWLILANAIGAVLYLIVASRLWWIEPELADIPGASGGSAFIWFPVSVYFCVTFIAVNTAALLRHIFVLFGKHGQKLSLHASGPRRFGCSQFGSIFSTTEHEKPNGQRTTRGMWPKSHVLSPLAIFRSPTGITPRSPARVSSVTLAKSY